MLNTDVMMSPDVSEKIQCQEVKNLRGGGVTTAAAHVQVWLKWWCELLHLQTSSQ